MIRPWKKLSSEIAKENPWWKYKLDRFELPSGRQGEYHYLKTPGAVSIFPIQDDGRLLFVKQYRFLADRVSLECPAGGIKAGQTPEETAHRELAEEVGKRAERMERVGSIASCLGLMDEWNHAFIATGLSPATAERDETEEFEIVALTVEEIERAVANGEMFNAFAIAPWHLAKPRIVELVDAMKKNG